MPQFVKKNVEYEEYFIQRWVFSLVQNLNKNKSTHVNIKVPKIIKYNENDKELIMQHLNGDNLSNIYGDNLNDVPEEYIQVIRNFIEILDSYLINYVDITGYNFMLVNKHLYIIDFGHAKCRDKNLKTDEFIMKFINGIDSWNPEFA